MSLRSSYSLCTAVRLDASFVCTSAWCALCRLHYPVGLPLQITFFCFKHCSADWPLHMPQCNAMISIMKYYWPRAWHSGPKVSFFIQCTKTQLITFQNFDIQTCFSQFLWFFSLKCWFKGQIISRIHLSLPNAYKLMCFDRNINGNRDVKFLEFD